MKLRAIKDVRIRVNGVKQDIQEGEVIEVFDNLYFYKINGFVEFETTEIKDESKVEAKKEAKAKEAKKEAK